MRAMDEQRASRMWVIVWRQLVERPAATIRRASIPRILAKF